MHTVFPTRRGHWLLELLQQDSLDSLSFDGKLLPMITNIVLPFPTPAPEPSVSGLLGCRSGLG